MFKDKLKKETNDFLEKYVFKNSNFKEINEKNADDIINYIVVNYVSSLVTAKEIEHKDIDETLLKAADKAVDDISEN